MTERQGHGCSQMFPVPRCQLGVSVSATALHCTLFLSLSFPPSVCFCPDWTTCSAFRSLVCWMSVMKMPSGRSLGIYCRFFWGFLSSLSFLSLLCLGSVVLAKSVESVLPVVGCFLSFLGLRDHITLSRHPSTLRSDLRLHLSFPPFLL